MDDASGHFARLRAREMPDDPLPGADPEAMRVILIGRMMAYLLRQRGWLSLHGSGVSIDGRAVLTVRRTARTDTLVLDLLDLRVDSVLVNQRSVKFGRDSATIRVPLPPDMFGLHDGSHREARRDARRSNRNEASWKMSSLPLRWI